MKRRAFIDFLGRGALIVPAVPSVLSACKSGNSKTDAPLFPSSKDDVVLVEGMEAEVLIKWEDPINKTMAFGYNNDYIAYLPTKDNEGILWVNHETVNPIFASGYEDDMVRHRDMILREMLEVGGTILKVRKAAGQWKPVLEDPVNTRLTAMTKIPFEWPEPISGATEAMGTLANCSGGVTPWGTILTCEENYDIFYGEKDFETGERTSSNLGWEMFFFKNQPEHYGWVVEVDVQTGTAKKHVGLGRFSHECATVKELSDGRVVIYSGDDMNGGCLYKFISDESGQIFPGQLYAANLEAGRWELLDVERPELATKFASQTEVMVWAREAAKRVGGTPLDRPEDIEIDPLSGDVLIALTNNKPQGNYHGSIMKITEQGDYDALEFIHDTFLTGGEETGFSCPDNLAFDAAGNLWFTSDISGSAIGKEPYQAFGNNGLYVLLRNGEQAGELLQVGSAPNDAEFTGPYFASDGETLFLSVQHPGDESKSLSQLTSHWPGGGTTIPRSAVIAIQGTFIRGLQTVV